MTKLRLPSGPGVRVDAGIAEGDVIGGNFDSLLAKVIVTGETRAEALERARRALDEMVVDGMATALPFHRLVVRDPAFTDEPFRVHTRWIETEWTGSVEPFDAAAAAAATPPANARPSWSRWAESGSRCAFPPVFPGVRAPLGQRSNARPGRRAGAHSGRGAASGDTLSSPMQGTIVKVAVADGDEVAEGDLIVVLEAMKMEQPLNAHKAGTVSGLAASVGATVTAGAPICTIA